MPWKNWLVQLESMAADDPAWTEFDAFTAAAIQIAAAKQHQRESARAALEETLLSLRERDGIALAHLGVADLTKWQSEPCTSTQALRLVQRLHRLQELLQLHSDSAPHIPTTPQEFLELRRQRNAWEDEILLIATALNLFFENPQADTLLDPPAEPAVVTVIAEPTPVAEAAVEEPSAPEANESSTAPADPSLTDSTTREAIAIETANGPQAVAETTAAQPNTPQPPVTKPEAAIYALSSIEANNGNGYVTQPNQVAPAEEKEEVITELPTTEPKATPVLEEPAISPEPEVQPSAVADLAPRPDPVVQPEAPVQPTGEAQPESQTQQVTAPTEERTVLVPPPNLPAVEPGEDLQPLVGEVIKPSETTDRKLKIFISSPGDVGQERVIAMRVVDRLQTEYASYLDLEPILWEHEPLRATSHFQDQILAPSLSNIVICILWSRLGTRLPKQFRRADGSHYSSGTEWEFEDALASYKKNGTPDLMVYRKSAEPQASMSDEAALLDRLAQKRALDTFIDRWFGNPQDTFKAAFHQFHSPDEFERILENHLRRLIVERLPDHITEDGANVPIRWHHGSPFRGLKDFDPEHAPVFFGRTRAISEVSSHLASRAAEGCAFVVVFGMSGCGKSSMVKAGLLPTITQPGVVEGVGLWRWASTQPGGARDPIFGLATALLEKDALPELHAQGLDATEIAALLREAPQRIVRGLQVSLNAAAENTAKQENLHQIPQARLAIIVDQLEEIFTQEGLDPEERRRFIVVLQTLAKSGLVWIMATMRSDFFVRCAEIPELMELKEGLGQYHLLPPTFAELSQILTQPARSAGLRFEVNPETNEKLSDILQEAAGKDPGALPLLEFTLDELFQRRSQQGVLTFDAYNELGGIEGALGRRAEEVFLGLPMEVQEELPSVLRVLVTVSEDVNSKEIQIGARRAPMSQLVQNPQRRQLVDAFVAARLLISDQEEKVESESGGSPEHGIVRVAHEALLRHWPRLQKWLANDLEFLRTRARVMNSAAQWTENRLPEYLLRQGRPLSEAEDLLNSRKSELEPATIGYILESRRMVRRGRNIRLGIITGVLATFIAVVSGFGVFSFKQWKKNERQKQMALAAVNKWTYDVPGKLAGIPATRPALKTIFQENIRLLNDIEGLDPQTSGLQREKAANLDRMGDTWMLLGDSSQAKQAYEQSLTLLTAVNKNDATPAHQRDLATSLEKIGDWREQAGDMKGAESAFDQSLDIRRNLATNAPNPDIMRELSVSLEKMGNLQREQKDYTGCLANLKESWDIRNKLAGDKTDVQAQRDLFVCAVAIGDVYLDQGKNDSAQKTFQNIMPLAKERVKAKALDAQRDLAALYDRMGDIQVNEGKASKALELYKLSLAISQELAQKEGDAQAQRDLLTSWERIGNLQNSIGDSNAALGSFAKALPLAENLANDGDNLEAQESLLDLCVEIGDTQLQLGTLQLAHAAYQRALTQYKKITEKWPTDAHARSQAANAYGQLAYLKLQFHQPKEALDAALQGSTLAPDQKWIDVNLVEAYVFCGQFAKAQALCTKDKATEIQGVPFKQALLTDIQQLASGGLTHPDFAKLKAWLLQN